MILLAAKRLRPKFPMAIVVMGLGALATVLFDLPGHGVACLGAVEPGLPALHLPDWSAVSLTEGLGSSLPVAVVIMAETLLAESSFAMRTVMRFGTVRSCWPLRRPIWGPAWWAAAR